ncbi:retinol dehydrogenase 11-like [Tachypleus tridentatus]|uniref:retinol dehydrogenase 11-like n=1 Tax=Tachypleus tridentatus TaxID=6853 RepID=UPI003FD6025B
MEDGIWTLLQNDFGVLFQSVCIWWIMALISAGLLMLKVYSKLTLGICKYKTNLSGKTVIVTGGNTGIGKETAKELARRHASVVLACRNQEKGKMAAEDIIDSTGNTKIEVMVLDLSSQKSVREFVDKFKRTHDRLDILINNAGVFALPERTLTAEGYEMTFATNHLGHFLLTNLLLDMLKKCAPARIITVSSINYKLGVINFDNLNSERYYTSDIVYSHTKLANILFTRELANRLAGTGVTAYSLHPGLVHTDIFRHYHGVRRFLVDVIVSMYGKTAEEGAQTTIYLAMAPGIESLSGEYFADCKMLNTRPKAKDMQVAQKLWEVSEHMTKLQPQTPTDIK